MKLKKIHNAIYTFLSTETNFICQFSSQCSSCLADNLYLLFLLAWQ